MFLTSHHCGLPVILDIHRCGKYLNQADRGTNVLTKPDMRGIKHRYMYRSY